MSEHVLVTGASGFIGRALVARLHADGFRLTATGRGAPPAPAGVRAAALPTAARTGAWEALLKGVDVVVHCAARAHVRDGDAAQALARFREANRDATVTLFRAAAAAGVRRFIFLSSIGVLGDRTFDAPFSAGSPLRPHSPYAVAKAEAEEALRQISADAGIELVVIRAPLVIGKGAKGNLGALAGAIRRRLPLPLGRLRNNRRDLVSLETLTDLIAACVHHPAAAGETFLVADGVPLSTRSIAERLAELEGLPVRFVPVPSILLGAGLRLLGRGQLAAQLLGNLEVDISHTRSRLGWNPPTRTGA